MRFVLTDATGRAFIDPNGAKLVITEDSHTRSGTFDDATPREEAFLAAQGEKSEGWIFNRSLRYREGVLEPGEWVAVLGHGTVSYDDAPAPAPHAGGYRQQAGPKKLEIRAAGQVQLYISDDVSVLR